LLEGLNLMSLAALLAWLLSTLGIAHAPSTFAAPYTAAVQSLAAQSSLAAAKPVPAIGGGGPVHKKK
jgi:hypothetical protein